MDADVSHGLEHEHMKDLLHEKLSELYNEKPIQSKLLPNIIRNKNFKLLK